MERRDFTKALAGLIAAAALEGPGRTEARDDEAAVDSGPLAIAMLLYPGMTSVDYVAPQLCWAGLPGATMYQVWKTRDPVVTDSGLVLTPTTTLADCPRDLDVLFVGGGSRGTWPLMNDPEIVDFFADRGSRARWVTSVCTGSLLLGAAGLLKGYDATSHWAVRDLLPILGARLVKERVVEDRNRITGGGVTAGLDFGLRVSARLRGQHLARLQQLFFEYDPQPPFRGGSPEKAGPRLTHEAEGLYAPMVEAARTAAVEAARRLGL